MLKQYWKNKGSIIYKEKLYSCQNINKKIAIVKKFLQQNQFSKNTVFAIAMERGVWPVAVMFGMLGAGNPFLVIDMSLPQKRRQYMMEHLNVDIVITENRFQKCFDNKKVIMLHELERLYEEKMDVENGKEESCEEDTAYFIYTSGSTGRPKAVEITQRGLRNFMDEFPQKVPMSSGQKIASFASMSFDIFFLEMVAALKKGMQVVLSSEEQRTNAGSMIRLIQDNRVNVLQLTPSHLQMLSYYDPQFSFMKEVQMLLVGGETFPQCLLKSLQENTKCRIFNLYGPTETTVWSSTAELTEENEVHIGNPIANVKFCIVNEKGQQAEEGEEGEICIAGRGVGNGYKNDKELTDRLFFYPSFEPTVKYYHTGDWGKREHGKYYCLGRTDNQIKYRGHRIELEEIDMCLCAIPGILKAATYFDKKGESEQLYALYESKERLDQRFIRLQLEEQLAEYMIPKNFYRVDQLYLSTNGKIDRKKNYKWYITENHVDRKDSVLNVIKERLYDRELIITDHSLFEELSIDSLDFVYIVVELEELFDIEFEEEMLSFHRYETVMDLVEYINYLRNNG